MGKIVDRVGNRVILMLVSLTILIGAHLILASLSDTNDPDYKVFVCIFMFVLFYSMYASTIWPSFPLVVEEYMVGTAFGIVIASKNAILCVTPLCVAWIRDQTSQTKSGYFWTEIFLMGLAGAAWFVTIGIYIIDKRDEGKLNSSTKRVPSRLFFSR